MVARYKQMKSRLGKQLLSVERRLNDKNITDKALRKRLEARRDHLVERIENLLKD